MASPVPSAFCDWTVEASRFFAGLFPSLLTSAFPFLPLASFSAFFAGAFFGLGSGFGRAGLADNRADLLCGSSFTFPLSPLASPFAFLLGMVAAALGSPRGSSVFLTVPRKISESRGRPRGAGLPAAGLQRRCPGLRQGRHGPQAGEKTPGAGRCREQEGKSRQGCASGAAGFGQPSRAGDRPALPRAKRASASGGSRPTLSSVASAPRPGAREIRKGGVKIFNYLKL